MDIIDLFYFEIYDLLYSVGDLNKNVGALLYRTIIFERCKIS